MPRIDAEGRVKIDSRYFTFGYIKPEQYNELELVQIDDYTYKLLWSRNINCDHKRVIGGVCSYDGKYLTIPEEVRECYGDIVFLYVEHFTIHLRFMNSSDEEIPVIADDKELERLEKSYVVMENKKRCDETWEEFFNLLPRSLRRAIFYSQNAHRIKSTEEINKNTPTRKWVGVFLLWI